MGGQITNCIIIIYQTLSMYHSRCCQKPITTRLKNVPKAYFQHDSFFLVIAFNFKVVTTTTKQDFQGSYVTNKINVGNITDRISFITSGAVQ